MKKTLLLILGATTALAAQASTLILSDFDSFAPSSYGIGGSWSATTALSGTSSYTIADFSAGTPKNDGSFIVSLPSVQNYSAYAEVNLMGSVFSGNASDSVSFFMEDQDGNAGVTTFDLVNGTATKNLSGLYSQVDETRVVIWGFTTENQMGDKNFAFTFDKVSLTIASVIPEPSSYASYMGLVALTGVLTLRRRSVRDAV